MSDERTVVSNEAHEIPVSDMERDAVTGGDILVDVMRQAGVDVAFGVISIHNLPLVEAVDRELRFVPMRHEAAVINAADGYARATGKIGVALTSTGTGAGNAAGAMLEALTASSRVLHITGNVNADVVGQEKGAYHAVPRQRQMLDAVSQHALTVDAAEDSRATLDEAVRLLGTAPYGPVSVDWPIDLQYLAKPSDQQASEDSAVELRAADRADLDRALDIMRAAKRPLLWVGGGAREAAADVTRLAEAWGAGVVTGAAGRGTVPETHPLIIGNFPTDQALDELWSECDCLLTLGSHLRGNETRSFELGLPANHVQVDLDADVIGINFPVVLGMVADVRAVAPVLADELGEVSTDAAWADRVRGVAATVRERHQRDIGAYAGICQALTDQLPEGTVVVRDVTIPGSSWGNRLLPLGSPRDNVFAAGGGIGQGLAQSIGAGVARGDGTVVALVGDGGLQVHLGELAVLAQEQPHVVVVLFNDGGYGVLRNLQTARGAEPQAVDLHTPDFASVCQGMRVPHEAVSTPEEFAAALGRSLAHEGPSLIEVRVDALDPAPTPMVPPVEAPNA